MAGGMGTRSADPEWPKVLQEVARGKRILDLIIDLFQDVNLSNIVFALGYRSDLVIPELLQKRKLDSRISWIVSEPNGTAAALQEVCAMHPSTYFIVMSGDSAVAGPLNNYVRKFERSGASLAFGGRLTDHPEDSDTVTINSNGIIQQYYPKKQKKPERLLHRSLSGFAFLTRSSLPPVGVLGDWESATLCKALEQRVQVPYFPNSHYARDSGTSDRLLAIQADIKNGSMHRRSKLLRPGIFLDRDNTLIPDTGTSRVRVLAAEIHLSVIEAIKEVNGAGIPIFLVTNQPGVAKGEITQADVEGTFSDMQNILLERGAFVDDYFYCPHHPDSGFVGEVRSLKVVCHCRKPKIGLLVQAAEMHSISLATSIMIGDSWRDAKAAKAANMRFTPASYDGVSGLVSNAIRQSLREINLADY
jgi:D,D-heptose 1,7-bisphosphate phosphatase